MVKCLSDKSEAHAVSDGQRRRSEMKSMHQFTEYHSSINVVASLGLMTSPRACAAAVAAAAAALVRTAHYTTV